MDHIQNRLGSIEAFVKGIPVSLMPRNLGDNIQPPAAESIGSIPGAASDIDLESSDEEPAFAGDSGLTAQTTFANDFLEKAVQKTSLHEHNPRMKLHSQTSAVSSNHISRDLLVMALGSRYKHLSLPEASASRQCLPGQPLLPCSSVPKVTRDDHIPTPPFTLLFLDPTL